jgi:hypothetical protein
MDGRVQGRALSVAGSSRKNGTRVVRRAVGGCFRTDEPRGSSPGRSPQDALPED